jgi:hypothetical protein
MSKKLIVVILLALGMMFQGASLWADDDAIMDVDDNAASFSGSWGTSTVRILYYGDDYQFASGSGGGETARATFKTYRSADITGKYHVYVRWTAGTMRATNANYQIYDSSDTYLGACTKDQRYNGGAWQYCSNVYLTSGRRGVVRLGNASVPTDRFVCADAVRFVRVSKDRDDIVDEAGGDYTYSSSANFTLTGSLTTVLSTSVSAPSSGKVIVNAYGQFYLYSAGLDRAGCWITTGTGTDYDHSVFAGEAAAGYYMQFVPFALTRGFDVSSGTQTYRLICVSEAGSVRVWRPHLTAIFVPTTY